MSSVARVAHVTMLARWLRPLRAFRATLGRTAAVCQATLAMRRRGRWGWVLRTLLLWGLGLVVGQAFYLKSGYRTHGGGLGRLVYATGGANTAYFVRQAEEKVLLWTLLYATLRPFAAGGAFATSGGIGRLAGLAATPLQATELLLGTYLALVGLLLLDLAALAPLFAALAHASGLDQGMLAAAALTFVLTVLLVTALGMVVSPGSRTATQGVLRVVFVAATMTVAMVGADLRWGQQGTDLLESLLPLTPLGIAVSWDKNQTISWIPVAASLSLTALLLALAEFRIRRRLDTRVLSPARPDPATRGGRQRQSLLGGLRSLDGVRARVRADLGMRATGHPHAPRTASLGSAPLDWLWSGIEQRRRAIGQLVCVALVVAIAVLGPGVGPVHVLRRHPALDSVFSATLVLAATLCFIGAALGWERLRAGGFLRLAAATPIPASAYTTASFAAAFRLAFPFLLLLASAALGESWLNGLGLAGTLLSLSLITASLLLLAVLGLTLGAPRVPILGSGRAVTIALFLLAPGVLGAGEELFGPDFGTPAAKTTISLVVVAGLLGLSWFRPVLAFPAIAVAATLAVPALLERPESFSELGVLTNPILALSSTTVGIFEGRIQQTPGTMVAAIVESALASAGLVAALHFRFEALVRESA